MQVLKQCAKWCPDVEPVMTSMQPAAAARQAPQPAAQQPAAQGGESGPQWGWDDLKYAAGDTLNTGGHSQKPHSVPLAATCLNESSLLVTAAHMRSKMGLMVCADTFNMLDLASNLHLCQ